MSVEVRWAFEPVWPRTGCMCGLRHTISSTRYQHWALFGILFIIQHNHIHSASIKSWRKDFMKHFLLKLAFHFSIPISQTEHWEYINYRLNSPRQVIHKIKVSIVQQPLTCEMNTLNFFLPCEKQHSFNNPKMTYSLL